MEKKYPKNKMVKIFVALLLLTAASGLIYLKLNPKDVQKEEISQENKIQVPSYIILNIAGVNYETELTEDTSLYELMEKLSNEGKISFSGTDYGDMGFFIDEINGTKNDDGAGLYWIFYVNGNTADVGASDYIIKDGDYIEWKYEKPNF